MAALTIVVSCKKDDDSGETEIPDGDGTVELQSEVNEFIWKGMNYWYFWQADQPLLADNKFADTDEFYTFLNNYSSSESLFDDLVYQPNVVDDFSWYIPDLDEQLDSFRGITTSFGISFPSSPIQVGSDAVVIYIAYVVPNSPADVAGLKRGDIIYKVDGVESNLSNYQTVLNSIFYKENISIEITNIVDGTLEPIEGEFTMTSETITSNPVHYYDIIERGSQKIGYLVFNAFRAPFNGELNDVFGEFKDAGIDELILDLRYNGGGSVLTSAMLASMINGSPSAYEDTFARLQYNSKRDAAERVIYPFFGDVYLYDKTTSEYLGEESINRLTTVSHLYVLASRRTASASEMIINGLRPYMPVTIIGEQTVGKNEGSITVVDAPGGDSPYTDIDKRNPNHTVAMQPIVFHVYNSLDQSDYSDGFLPDIEVREYEYTADIKPFGDPEEALLSVALEQITGLSSKKVTNTANTSFQKTSESLQLPKFSNEMYILPGEHLK